MLQYQNHTDGMHFFMKNCVKLLTKAKLNISLINVVET